jgi:hypothetical protein
VATLSLVPRAPQAELRVRRAIDHIADILDALIFNGDLVLTGQGAWTVGPSGGSVLATEVFGQKVALMDSLRLPHPEDASAALASRAFASRVSYGVVG